ncbi:MAG TPA: 1-acyl-sn-glycerol-3-phosphate acyltransferase, partial [Gemmatimonadales bacterium]
IEAGVPILPLAVSGTGPALPKHDWRFGRSSATVRVLEPVETAGLTLEQAPELKETVRRMIVEARDALRAGGS